ncbi:MULTISPECIES: hypothetical protein [unclassified Granulicatella]|uniref:hypothetical protein n=1 Tax=unclassified Granulicatella TaxID=2630493 RepID=UPI001074674F|nr:MULTISPECIES: hypothetical protein [unclassified Granulicatella]MBF0779599.1 hypothetical protein [Granulicatella sp. 19428wC4_WM01]TFU96398.1 hypothetical protein E4T68_00680 [Granulicatella sp. WM01]
MKRMVRRIFCLLWVGLVCSTHVVLAYSSIQEFLVLDIYFTNERIKVVLFGIYCFIVALLTCYQLYRGIFGKTFIMPFFLNVFDRQQNDSIFVKIE